MTGVTGEHSPPVTTRARWRPTTASCSLILPVSSRFSICCSSTGRAPGPGKSSMGGCAGCHVPASRASARRRASAFASRNSRSRLTVIASLLRKKRISCASAALVETVANAIVSKARREGVNGPPVLRAIWSSKVAPRRTRSSLHPPPAGINPTPTSTRPIYDSAWARTWLACMMISQPPPKARPEGAATIGIGLYLSSWWACWRPSIAASIFSHWPAFAPMRTSMRLAPAEKSAASLLRTTARNCFWPSSAT